MDDSKVRWKCGSGGFSKPLLGANWDGGDATGLKFDRLLPNHELTDSRIFSLKEEDKKTLSQAFIRGVTRTSIEANAIPESWSPSNAVFSTRLDGVIEDAGMDCYCSPDDRRVDRARPQGEKRQGP